MIRLANVWFSYDGRRPVLDVPSLEIPTGLTVIVGPNGAGKSTLLRVLSGIERPTRGTVSVGDFDLWRDEVEARRQLALVTEYPELTPYATVIDLLRLVASLRGATAADVMGALERVGLPDLGHRTVRELSMGQRRRAMFATALIGTPPIVILDEPLETLDAGMRDFVREWVLALRSENRAVLVATHDVGAFVSGVDFGIAVRGGVAQAHVLGDIPVDQRAAWLAAGQRGVANPLGPATVLPD